MTDENEKKLRLVKYSDNELRGSYIWFFINSDDEKISDDFETEEAAQGWLDNVVL